MALALGGEHFHQFLRKLGMFDYTDIEIPEKTKPLTPKRWPDITTMTVSFGHGISITPVHLAKAYGAVINGGKLLPLSILKHDPNSKLKYKQVIKPETSEKVRKIMRAIVISGTGRGAEVKGYVVGGKTGTAEKIVNGRYSGDKVMSSFAGAFPMNKPKYLVVVIVDDPKEKVRYVRPTGGVVAAPAVKNIVSRTGTMLGIKPNFDTEFDKTVYNSEEDDSVDQSHQD